MSDGFTQRNMLFSVNQKGEVRQHTGASVTLKHDSTHHLLKLAEKYKQIVAATHPEGLRIKIGPHVFLITIGSVYSAISLQDIISMDDDMAALVIQTCEIFFPKRGDTLKLKTSNLHSEFLVWKVAREYNIALEPKDDNQGERFAYWEQQLQQAELNDKALFQAQKLSDKLAKRIEPYKRAHSVTLYTQERTLSPLSDLILTYERLDLHEQSHNRQLLTLGEAYHSVIIDSSRYMFNILDIDLTKPGAGELLAKISEAIFYEMERRIEVTAPALAQLRQLWHGFKKHNFQIYPTDDKQAQHLNEFERQWQQENNKQLMSMFNQLNEFEHENKAEQSGPGLENG